MEQMVFGLPTLYTEHLSHHSLVSLVVCDVLPSTIKLSFVPMNVLIKPCFGQKGLSGRYLHIRTPSLPMTSSPQTTTRIEPNMSPIPRTSTTLVTIVKSREVIGKDSV
uniref:Uncharacterized protein n=1 Tax=Bionectria ochroleuca TaxID=29856 RepID=A0A8H7NNV6_BIOOC